jgi:hypothetical protein
MGIFLLSPSTHTSHPTPSLQSPPTTRGGMAHEEQNNPVAQSTSKSPTTSTADMSERDNKEIPVVKEEETNDTEVFEEVVVEVARLPKELKSSVLPPPGSSTPPPGSSTALLLCSKHDISLSLCPPKASAHFN